MNDSTVEKPRSPVRPSFGAATRFWFKLGLISFGGPAGQIAIMHSELVEKKRWISEARFLHALNYCMLLPGPEAQQLATYVGWLLHKTAGGVVAGALFVIPSMFILWALSFIYVSYGALPWVAALFYGLKPAVLAIVASAVIRIGGRALKNEVMWTLAALAFIAIFFLKVPFPLIIVAAALIGFIGGKVRPDKFLVIGGHDAASTASAHETVISDEAESAEHTRPSIGRALKVFATWGTLWICPVLALGLWLGTGHALFREAIFFSKASMVTFGGAYAVLPYVSQQAVETHHWLAATQMLDGIGLAETTPGPLIIVLQFVGFLGGWNQPGSLSPLLSATIGAFITTWTTFIPCFLWIFLGAPHIEQLRGNKNLSASLSSVTAAVVGVISNLAVWFGLHVLFPGNHTADWFAITVAAITFTGLLRWKWGIIPVVFAAGALGILYKTFL
ncbi:MAG: chromate transporter [Chthoniobacteraceae bacterium]|nr:chromate transporter [Chthoniobacteraceae bacterium]